MSEANPLKMLSEAELVDIKQNIPLVRELALMELAMSKDRDFRPLADRLGTILARALDVLQLEDLIRKQPVTVEPATTPNQGFRRDQ